MFKKSVDSVLKTFTQAITDLENIADTEGHKAEECYFRANELQAIGTRHEDEADRAAATAERIRSLVEG